MLTLHVLADLREELEFELTAITVDEGIQVTGARPEVARRTPGLKVELIEKSFMDEFGFGLIMADGFRSPCISAGSSGGGYLTGQPMNSVLQG